MVPEKYRLLRARAVDHKRHGRRAVRCEAAWEDQSTQREWTTISKGHRNRRRRAQSHRRGRQLWLVLERVVPWSENERVRAPSELSDDGSLSAALVLALSSGI
jgi:hypothetical protein